MPTKDEQITESGMINEASMATVAVDESKGTLDLNAVLS